MIDKYYNGAIEQVYNRIGKSERNIVMVTYNNDFSIAGLDNVKRYQQQNDNVFFAWHEFEYGTLANAYEPFLDTICKMYRTYVGGDFNAFLTECHVYELQRVQFLSYYETGVSRREERVLLNEVPYEQNRMVASMTEMIQALAKIHPIVLVINRFQLASRSAIELVSRLIAEPSDKIGIVLGVNEMQVRIPSSQELWDTIVERLGDSSQLYHIGSSGRSRELVDHGNLDMPANYKEKLKFIKNVVGFLDYEQAKYYFEDIEHKIKFEDMPMEDDLRCDFYLEFARNSILLGELSKALELVAEIYRIKSDDMEHYYRSECALLRASCFMYQGKLDRADKCAKIAGDEARECGDEELLFRAELLAAMARMSGWYNLFFCLQDIPVEESLIEKMMKYNYKNHLAHFYIYAYDNRPEIVAKAYQSEDSLFYFSKGVALAKEIGNMQLVHDAYEKNIMLASTSGMNEIALLYAVRTYQFTGGRDHIYAARNFSGIGYNLSAMGQTKEAQIYYSRAIEIFWRLRLPEEIAEVYYNQALNYIAMGEYDKAEHDLQFTMKVIEKMHLNSLRVANLSKLYALLALACILQNDNFNCERYLVSCRQFLSYVIEREKENQHVEVVHDYAMCDDDMFLYRFAVALFNWENGDNDVALTNFENAEYFLTRAEGNQYFCHDIYRRKRMEFFREQGRNERYEREKMLLGQHEELCRQIANTFPKELLEEVELESYAPECSVGENTLESLVRQEGLLKEHGTMKNQMDFINSWQKLIDVSDVEISTMVKSVMGTFCNYFNLDCALYIFYNDEGPQVLYNDTGHEMTDHVLRGIYRVMLGSPEGFAVSKISDRFFEYEDAISYFGVQDVCSFVAVPFLKNGRMTSLLITYVCMKDNWHSSIERYMLNDDDLHIYKLLFMELEHAINRMEADAKVREMNSKLQQAAVTDMLTGIYNRAGMYEEIHKMGERIRISGKSQRVGLMFIDLDNFKHYNDSYGHIVGDRVLQEMAEIFREVVEGKGFVSRFGGDEFILILNTDDRNELESIAKEIYAKIGSANGFKDEIENHLGYSVTMNQDRMITCSIGIAQAGNIQKEEDIDQLISKADDLLYSVKTGEKGHYAFL